MAKGKFPTYKTVDIDTLIPYARNSRTHSDAQITKIAASIKEFGFLNPVIIDSDNGIVAGHGRVLAAKKLGMAELPVIEANHLTDAQRRAYVIADNRLALDADWDIDMLKVEFDELLDLGFDLDLTGFGEAEIDMLKSGWEVDGAAIESDGDAMDGLLQTLKIKIEEHDKQQAKEVITNALDAQGVEYEWG